MIQSESSALLIPSDESTLPSEQRIRYSLWSKRCVHLMDSIGSRDESERHVKQHAHRVKIIIAFL